MVRPERLTATIDLAASLDFAALSGDYNPLHVDPIAARRLRFGTSVAHGIHVLLHALDTLLDGGDEPVRLTSVRARFTAPVPTGEPFTVRATSASGTGVAVRVETAAGVAADVTVAWTPNASSGAAIPDAAWDAAAPDAATIEHAAEGRIPLRWSAPLGARLFPHAAARVPHAQLATLVATTNLVGMRFPGLHSVYADLALEFDDGSAHGGGVPELTYATVRADRRFGLVQLRVEGPGANASVGALFRSAPADQPAFAAVRERVAPDAFCDARALVVGGSRGLGETLAKVLAAGGADVVATYRVGAADAERVAAEIRAGGGRCTAARYDAEAGSTDLDQRAETGWDPTHVYYFATPAIAASRARWDAALFERFRTSYVDGFVALVDALERRYGARAGGRVYVYPSTVYVDDAPAALGEYAAAKAAGEAAARAVARRTPSVAVVVERLPRLLTDQTASGGGATPEDPLDPLIALATRAHRHAGRS